MYSGETTVSKDILESVLRGGDILKVRGLWRPKEDDPSKKLVKLHQKHEPINNKPLPTPPPNNKIEEKKAETTLKSSIPPNSLAETNKDKAETKEQATMDETSKNSEETPFLVIKEEPLEWNDVAESEMELVDEHEFHTEMTIKPEVLMEQETSEEEMYSPLTCELCTETFMIPAEWVKHIQTHTDMLPAKRQRRGRSSVVSGAIY